MMGAIDEWPPLEALYPEMDDGKALRAWLLKLRKRYWSGEDIPVQRPSY